MKKILLAAGISLFTISGFAQLPKDPVTYPVAEGYQIESLWGQYSKLGNKPTVLAGNNSRGMAVLNGKIYVTLRKAVKVNEKSVNNGILLIYDAKTGAFEKELPLTGDGISEVEIMTTNDVQVDDAGHLLVSSLSTNLSSENDPFTVWMVNPETGVAKTILKYTNPLDVKYRIDCFGVYGDITKDGYLMAAISKDQSVGGDQVLQWQFKNGVFSDSEAKYIKIQEYANGKPLEGGNSDAPRVTPIDENLFYLDPQSGWATMYMMVKVEDGYHAVIADGFNKESLKDFQPEDDGGNNGVDEFTFNNDHFVIYVISNTANKSGYPQAWNLCKLGEGMAFEGMKKIARIPEAGMGDEPNVVRTALPRIEVENDAAYIYLFATNGGLAAYKMTVAATDALNQISGTGNIRIQDNQIVCDEVASIEIYTVAGQRVDAKANVTTMALPLAQGMYIIKACFENKQQVVLKAIVE